MKINSSEFPENEEFVKISSNYNFYLYSSDKTYNSGVLHKVNLNPDKHLEN